MRVLENNYGWNPIGSAPLDRDVTLEVTDGRGAPYRLPNPCRRTARGWVSSSKGTPLAVTPVRWEPPTGSEYSRLRNGRRFRAAIFVISGRHLLPSRQLDDPGSCRHRL
jgi:hypothetical protein